MTTAVLHPALPVRPVPMVRRTDVRKAVDHFTESRAVRVVELVLAAGEVSRLVVHWKSGIKTQLAVDVYGELV